MPALLTRWSKRSRCQCSRSTRLTCAAKSAKRTAVGDVELQRHGASALRLDLLADLGRLLGAAAVGDDDIDAALGELQCSVLAEAAAGAGDEGNGSR